MKKTRRFICACCFVGVIFPLVALCPSAEKEEGAAQKDAPGKQQVRKIDFKKEGQEIKKGTQEAGRELKESGKQFSDQAKKEFKKTGEALKRTGKEFKKGFYETLGDLKKIFKK